MEKDIIVIPDVHGREFWRQAVEKYPENDIIFLGDYLDPYPAENISAIEAIANLSDIIAYANGHANVTLLMGNHDLHYLYGSGEASRLDFANRFDIRMLLMDNISLFRIAALRKIGDKVVVFSHAPILEDWVNEMGETADPNELVDHLNGLLAKISHSPGEVARQLGQISHFRGGGHLCGSPVWADVRELDWHPIIPAIDMMIFGHTQLVKDPIITGRWACVDCRRAFRLTPEMQLIPIE